MKLDQNSENYMEFKEYVEQNPMSEKEKCELWKWVSSGHSVQSSPGSRYLCDPYPPQDFLATYRLDESLKKEMAGMTEEEKEKYLRRYMGYDEPGTSGHETAAVIPAARELFYLWEFIYKSGLGPQAEAYIEQHKNDEVPFE